MIPIDPTWQIKHSWRVRPSRGDISKVLDEMKIVLEKTVQADLGSRVYLASDELLRNSMEHGCFKIGGEKKAQLLELGTFEEFLNNLEEKLSDNPDHWIELALEIESTELTLKVRDSGEGYNFEGKDQKSLELTRLSNRGLEIVKGLAFKVVLERSPTQTIATFSLS